VDGIGYVFTADDPYFALDLDDVIERDTGEIDERAAEIIHTTDSYTEISCSGRGVHVFGQGKKPPEARCKSAALGITVEVYDDARFVVLTGQSLGPPRPVEDRQDALEALCARLWPPQSRTAKLASGAGAGDPVDLDDLELLERARGSRTGAKFRRLYDAGDKSGYASASEADFGLLNMLIFWTAGDRERIIRLFEASALYREKEKHRGYVAGSVDSALGSYVGNFYRPRGLSKARESRGQDSEPDPLEPYLEVLLDPSFWTGRRAASAYKAYAAAVILADEYGIVDDDGNLRIGSDIRRLAEVAGTSAATLSRSALPYLVQEKKLVRWRAGKGRQAGKFVLRKPKLNESDNTKVSTHFSVISSVKRKGALKTLRLLIRMRSGHSKSAKLLRLGMPAMFATIALVGSSAGGSLSELAERTGRRKSDLRTALSRLKAAGIAREVSEDTYRLTDDFAAHYERHLERSGIAYAEREQRRRHAEDRKARDAKLPGDLDKQPNPLQGKEKVTRLVAERRREDRARWIEEQRRKVGTTALTFLADEIDGEYGVRFKDALERWRNLQGGNAAGLWKAVHHGPFVFRRVAGDLFIDPSEAAEHPA